MRLGVGHVCFRTRNLFLTLPSEQFFKQLGYFLMLFTVEFHGVGKRLGNKQHNGKYKSTAAFVVLNGCLCSAS